MILERRGKVNKCLKCNKEIDLHTESFTTVDAGKTDIGWTIVKVICEECKEGCNENTLS